MRFRCNGVLGRGRLAPAAALILGVMVSVVLPTESAASVITVQFSTSPALSPAFNPATRDYVVRLTSGTQVVQVTVSNSDAADSTTTVSVDGQAPRAGAFTAQVSLDQGQGFKITAVQGATSRDYYVRSLPNGFPTWGNQRPGSPQAEYYVVVPVPSTGVGIANRYITLYDTNGVPIWWTRPENPLRPVDAKLLPNKDILWTESETTSAIRGLKAEHRRLDGTAVDDSISPVGYQLDAHEIQRLDNGNYLVIGSSNRCCSNLSSHSGPSSATIRDCVIQEVTPGGTAVWTWLAADHLGLDEVQQQWWSSIVSGGSPYDVFHLNSVVTGAAHDLLISFRYANAIYKITNPGGQTNPGKIIWKLGGSAPTKEPGTSLAISGDPVFASGSGFGGQHYARYFDAGDGKLYVTLHDNGSGRNRPPRGVRYEINEAAKTATMLEDVRDTASPNLTSPCCGSAGKLPTGNWVMSWGQNPLMTELTPSGSRALVLTFVAHSYRVDPVMPGVLTREQLRDGMDAQYPRIVNTTPTISSIGNQTINEDTSTGPLSFTVGDGQSAAGSLILGRSSSNTTLAPTNNIVFGGSGSNRTVTVTPATNQNGTATITVSVSDGQLSASTNFLLTVTAVNDTPTITGISNQTISVDGTTGPLNVIVGDVETAAASLSLRRDSSNLTLVPTNNIVFGGSGANRTVTVTPAANQSGTATIGVIVSDGALSASNSFVLTVIVPNNPPNPPSLNSPTNGATDVSTSPALSVAVSDPDTNNLTVTFYGRAASQAPGGDFTLVALPDTQYYVSSLNGGLPAMFTNQTQWIVNQRVNRNIQYVAQLGDCVQNGDNGGTNSEWLIATNALYRLENPLTTLLAEGVPYGVAVGNHDQSPIGSATGTTTFYNQYFGEAHFLPRGYYRGHYGANNDNHYDFFSAGGMNFIVVYFEYDAGMTTNSPVLAWANSVLQTNQNRRAIVVSHWIINDGFNATFSTQGQAVYSALKGNTNLFLMLCGHVTPPEGQRTDTYQGRAVWTLMSDYQGSGNGGNGKLRLYEFSPSNNVIHAKTYSPWVNQFETDADSQFDVPYVMTQTNPFAVVGEISGVPSGSVASASWTNLTPNSAYDWYVSVSDGTATATSPIWRFTTAAPNTAPMISSIGDQTIDEDTSTGPLNFTVNDGETAPGSLTLDKGSSDPTLAPADNIVFGGSGSNRTVTVTPASGQTGSATITVTVSDGTLSASNSFVLTIDAAPVIVPNVVGQTQNAAENALVTANLEVGAVTTASSATVAAGIVLDQNPGAGASVAEGTAVALSISTGPAPVIVPDVVGQAQSAAETNLVAASLSVGAISNASSATVAAGFVLEQNPSAGASVPPGAPIALRVSTGPSVPNVVSLTQAAATNAIISAGLSVGSISNAPHGVVPAGSVISQDPAAATSAAIGSPVDLVVSSGATIPVVSEAAYQNGVFQLSVPTLSGRFYILEFTDQLPATNWMDGQSVSGDGTVQVLIDSSATNYQRYYRVRME